MAIGDGMDLEWSLGAALWCGMTVGNRSTLRCRLALGGSGPAGKRCGLRPLAPKVARLRCNTSGKAVQNSNALLVLFPIQGPHTQRRHFTIVAIFSCLDPPDG